MIGSSCAHFRKSAINRSPPSIWPPTCALDDYCLTTVWISPEMLLNLFLLSPTPSFTALASKQTYISYSNHAIWERDELWEGSNSLPGENSPGSRGFCGNTGGLWCSYSWEDRGGKMGICLSMNERMSYIPRKSGNGLNAKFVSILTDKSCKGNGRLNFLFPPFLGHVKTLSCDMFRCRLSETARDYSMFSFWGV